MDTRWLRDAFEHHAWAQEQIVDACVALTDEQLGTIVPGTYGSILDTVRHLVGSDNWYLFVMTHGTHGRIDEDAMTVAELREQIPRDAAEWRRFLATSPEPDDVIERSHEDGSVTRAPLGIRLAQVVHHGTDHRSQVCTALTTLGLEPPAIDVWDFALATERMEEIPPPS
jgi:uncharacterized damage-inducible protein DinB